MVLRGLSYTSLTSVCQAGARPAWGAGAFLLGSFIASSFHSAAMTQTGLTRGSAVRLPAWNAFLSPSPAVWPSSSASLFSPWVTDPICRGSNNPNAWSQFPRVRSAGPAPLGPLLRACKPATKRPACLHSHGARVSPRPPQAQDGVQPPGDEGTPVSASSRAVRRAALSSQATLRPQP